MIRVRRIGFTFLLLISLAVLAIASSPALPADGHSIWNTVERAPVIEDNYAYADHPRAVSDGAGGVVVVWQHQTTGGIRIQRLNHAGLQQWISTGVVISATGYEPEIAIHPTGGVVVAWYETESAKTGIYVQRVTSGGSPSWTTGGVKIATTASAPAITATSTAGTFVAWRNASNEARIGNINDSGTPTAPGVDGVSLGANALYSFDIELVPAGLNSVIAVWSDESSPPRIVAQKVGPGFPWGATPTVVGAPTGRANGHVAADRDGVGGAIVAWRTSPWTATGFQIRAQRIDANGSPQWASDGEVLVDSTVVGGDYSFWAVPYTPAIASDGEGGAYVAWDDFRHGVSGSPNADVYLQRLDLSGFQPWDPYGIRLSPNAMGTERLPRLVTDRAGGVLVVYQELLNLGVGDNWEIMGARYDRSGNRHWEYPPYNDASTDAIDQLQGLVVFDGSGPGPQGAIYVWFDDEENDLYAEKIEVSRPIGDDCVEPPEIGPGDYEFNLAGTSAEMEASCGGVGADIWFRFVAPADGTLVVSTCGTHDSPATDQGVDTVLSLHSACPDGSGNYELACNDDWVGEQCAGADSSAFRDSFIQTSVYGGQELLIRASRFSSSFNGEFLLHVWFEQAPPPHDHCADAMPIGLGTHVGTLVAASTDSSTSCAGSQSDVWYVYTAPAESTHHFSTCGSNDIEGVDQGIDTVLSIHSACPETGNIHQLTCNDDAGGACGTMDQGATNDSRLTYLPMAGETIWIRVSRFTASFDGEFFLHIEADAPAAGRVPDDQILVGPPLLVDRIGSEVVLTWSASCVSSDTDFSVYVGPMNQYGLHEPITCTTTGLLEHRFLPPTGDNYFIVVPHNGAKEGSHGTRNLGAGPLERLPSPAVCYPQEIAVCP